MSINVFNIQKLIVFDWSRIVYFHFQAYRLILLVSRHVCVSSYNIATGTCTANAAVFTNLNEHTAVNNNVLCRKRPDCNVGVFENPRVNIRWTDNYAFRVSETMMMCDSARSADATRVLWSQVNAELSEQWLKHLYTFYVTTLYLEILRIWRQVYCYRDVYLTRY